MDAKKGEVQQTVIGRLRPANELVGYGLANGPHDGQKSIEKIKETVNGVS